MGMSLIVAAAMASATGSGCSWAHPGANPYRGAPEAVLADFAMPDDTRRQLRALMVARRYTDVVTITRDRIQGQHVYTDLRQMHSGHGVVCHGSVDRSAWSAKHEERGLVYCVGDTCVVVPTVCNNVSLLTRKPEDEPEAATAGTIGARHGRFAPSVGGRFPKRVGGFLTHSLVESAMREHLFMDSTRSETAADEPRRSIRRCRRFLR